MSDDIVARLFVGGPLHGQRKVAECAFYDHVCGDGRFRYTLARIVRQVKYFAEDETVDRIVYPKLHVMLDDEWNRRIVDGTTMRETVLAIDQMLTEDDWNWALLVANSAEREDK